MCRAIRERHQRFAGPLSLTPLHTLDSGVSPMSKGGASARNWLLPSIKLYSVSTFLNVSTNGRKLIRCQATHNGVVNAIHGTSRNTTPGGAFRLKPF